jgi:putative hydrolase
VSPIGTADTMPSLVDERAAMLAAALVTPRSRPTLGQVAALRAAVTADLDEVDRAARQHTRLAPDLPPAQIEILGRAGWVRANLTALRDLFEPLRARIGDKPGVAQLIGTQLGTVLGLLSTKVLGQYVLPLAGDGPGRLVVVGPNLLALEPRHGSLATELRRAVLLHEVTHRLQFAAAPWLADHLRGLVAGYVADSRLRPEALREASGRLVRGARARPRGRDAAPAARGDAHRRAA